MSEHSRDPRYKQWIDDNVPDYQSAYGKCRQVSERMQQAFPELKLVCGFYYCFSWGERTHFWLLTPEGQIVDPTKRQFPSGGDGPYEVLPPDYIHPSQPCMECASPCWSPYVACSESCAISLGACYGTNFEYPKEDDGGQAEAYRRRDEDKAKVDDSKRDGDRSGQLLDSHRDGGDVF